METVLATLIPFWLLLTYVIRYCVCLIPLLSIGISTPAVGAEPSNDAGTAAMAKRLREIDENMNVLANSYESRRRADAFGKSLETETNPVGRLDLMRKHAVELLNAGDSLEAVRAFEALEAHEQQFADSTKQALDLALFLKATSWLRLGEQENCILNHTSDSCLFPITGNGVHQLPKGSTEAIKLLESLLEKEPDQLEARWLLNVANMTLGEYPEGVPERWRIPPEVFVSDHDIKRFTDVAGRLGIDGNEVSGGTIAEDFNNDGYLDLMVSSYVLRDQIKLYINDGGGGFVDRTAESGLNGLTGGINMIQADYDNDGFTDVLVLRGAWLGRPGRIPNSLLRNNGDGTFSDVTKQVGIMTARPTQTACWIDYNGDGWLDLFIGNESTPGNLQRCELFTSNRDGTFRENSFKCGIRVMKFVKGVSSGDFNNDGRPDLCLSIMGGDNVLLRNDGPDGSGWKFTEASKESGIARPLNSFPCWFFDYDNDGWEDLLVCNFDLTEVDATIADMLGVRMGSDNTRLYRNKRNGTFEDVSERIGLSPNLLAMGANYGDLDNDGWLDVYIGTGNPDLAALVPNKMFRNNAGVGFQDVTTSGGFGHLQKGHAIAFADLDLDGDQDVYANMGGAYTGDFYRNALFLNPGHGNHWLSLKLEGRRSNRSAIGARIRVSVSGPSGSRTIHRTVSSGGSFGANPLRQEIGLGDATRIDRLEIFWPTTGKTQNLTDLQMDSIFKIVEGTDHAELVRLKPVDFKVSTAGHEHLHE